MTDVLIVDDEPGYCDMLQLALTRRGFRVETATNSRDAIDLGAWFRPDVLVADWILDGSHGLKVAETLRLVKPDLSLVLMTGFSLDDLELEARALEAFALLEKPFEMEHLVETIEAAAAHPAGDRPSPVATLGASHDGEIVFANPRARELLAGTRAGPDAERIDEIFRRDARRKLLGAAEEWQELEALADEPTAWQVRARLAPGSPGRLLVLLEGEQFLAQLDDEPHRYGNELLVRLLLDIPPELPPRWPYEPEERALVIDSSDMFRPLAVEEIELAGATCLAASGPNAALRMLQFLNVKVIILDAEVSAARPGFIEHLRDLRPDAVLVGQSLDRRPDAFAAHGIDGFLRKPWEIEELIRVLTAKAGGVSPESRAEG